MLGLLSPVGLASLSVLRGVVDNRAVSGWVRGLCRVLCFVSLGREEPQCKLLDQGSVSLIGVKPHGEESGGCVAHITKKCLHICRVTACMHPKIDITVWKLISI